MYQGMGKLELESVPFVDKHRYRRRKRKFRVACAPETPLINDSMVSAWNAKTLLDDGEALPWLSLTCELS
jgi:hypothetical protein